MPGSPKKQKSELLVIVGKNVQRFRSAHGGMTQEALAEAIGSNATYVSKIETGSANGLTLGMLEKFARALDVSVADLVEADFYPPDTDLPGPSRRLTSILYKLPRHNKKVAEKVITVLLKALNEKEE